MTQVVALQAIILDDGRIFISAPPESSDIAGLRNRAAELLPLLTQAPELETWASIRPATPDELPILGPLPGQTNHLFATGHYRNGILLAPATAQVIAQLIYNETPSIALSAYAPDRRPPPIA